MVHRATKKVMSRPGKGSTRWTGGQPGLGFRLCQAIKRLLVSDQVPVGLSRRAVEALARIREEFAWISADETALVSGTDSKTRRFEPESFPLADGVPARVGRLRGYGNAIVPPLAAEFIAAYREARGQVGE